MSDGQPAWEDDLRLLGLLWHGRVPSTFGPKALLGVPGIARAAVRIADAEGFAAVSMQRVAAELGFTKMALYRHIAGRAELLALMIEEAVGEPPQLHDLPGGWQQRLRVWAEALRAEWLRHPWLPGITIGARVMGPRELSWTEAAVATLDDSGLGPHERRSAVATLSRHVRGTHSGDVGGTQLWTVGGKLHDELQALMLQDPDRYPGLLAAAAQQPSPLDDDEEWQFGLRCILAGLAALVAPPSR